jgi:hypothetical protein
MHAHYRQTSVLVNISFPFRHYHVSKLNGANWWSLLEIVAGCLAHAMGLPIQLVTTVNSNDVVARMINTGIYSVSGPIIPSLAQAMDIQVKNKMNDGHYW